MPDDLPFPDLIDPGRARPPWPSPPFAWRHIPAPPNDEPQPCRIEGPAGTHVQGEMLDFDPASASLRFRSAADTQEVTLAFARVSRLTLTVPLRPMARSAGAPAERIPAAAQEREYSLHPPRGAAPLTGRTVGHVESDEGLYLFAPIDDEMSIVRQFVPHTAYLRSEFGPSAEQVAAESWITTPDALVRAIDRQQKMPIQHIGQSLLALGLLTQRQLASALTRLRGDRPLGKMLVDDGLISHHDLQTALAHKLGYPFVDLLRFPIDVAVTRLLPTRLAIEGRAVPLMQDGKRLIVAFDNPSRAAALSVLQATTGLQVVPVIASRTQLLTALAHMTRQDVWAATVAPQLAFFRTTT